MSRRTSEKWWYLSPRARDVIYVLTAVCGFQLAFSGAAAVLWEDLHAPEAQIVAYLGVGTVLFLAGTHSYFFNHRQLRPDR